MLIVGTLYYHFIPSLFAVWALEAYQTVFLKHYLQERDFDSVLVIELVSNLIWQILSLALLQILNAWVGRIYTDAEVLRSSNETLLNNMDEGVVIMEEESGVILFNNKAAKRFNICAMEEFSVSRQTSPGEREVCNKTEKLYAKIDKELL